MSQEIFNIKKTLVFIDFSEMSRSDIVKCKQHNRAY